MPYRVRIKPAGRTIAAYVLAVKIPQIMLPPIRLRHSYTDGV
jgi:hypothetical protein